MSLARRHTALRCGVGRYSLLGLNATWAHLTSTAHPSPDLRRDPAAMLRVRALEMLEASRAVRFSEVGASATRRRVENAAGRRIPRPSTRRPAWTYWPSETALTPGTHRRRGEPPHVVPAVPLSRTRRSTATARYNNSRACTTSLPHGPRAHGRPDTKRPGRRHQRNVPPCPTGLRTADHLPTRVTPLREPSRVRHEGCPWPLTTGTSSTFRSAKT